MEGSKDPAASHAAAHHAATEGAPAVGGALTVGMLAQRSPAWVAPDATLEDALHLMQERPLEVVAVRTRDGQICGALTWRHLALQRKTVLASDAMVPVTFTVSAEASVGWAVDLMLEGQLEHLFVDEDDEVVGVMSLRDVARGWMHSGSLQPSGAPRTRAESLSDMVKVPAPRELSMQSLQRCQPDDRLATVFYEKFLASSDEVRRHFRSTDMKAQKRKITATFHLASEVVLGAPGALAELTRQAELHGRGRLRIAPHLYALWVDALVSAVRECDPEFNPGTEQAWRLIMGHVVQHMKRRY